jgi:hypothetical protein
MNTNIKIELTDEQRVSLQEQLTGKRKPLTRDELRQFVSGCVTGALDCEEVQATKFEVKEDLTELPSKWADMYRGKSDHWRKGWLRGWTMVGNRLS